MSAQNMTMEKGISTDRALGNEGPGMIGKFEHARERATGTYEQVKARLMEKEAKVEGYVKEHPVRSVLVAAGIGAGVGLLVGALLSRR